jgi:hypothetical protein
VAVIIVGLFSSISLGYSGGTGVPNNPYQIGSVGDLLQLAADTNNYDKCFILTADVNLQGYVFTTAVIARDGNVFTGTFDGSDHKITNLKINIEIDNQHFFIGLLGYIGSNGSVKNLGIENYDIKGYYSNSGGLVGENDGNISNCYATGSVVDWSEYSGPVGGLVGYNSGNISDCCATGSVSAGWFSDTGGLVGGNSGSINHCHATCFVTSGEWDAGGLVGWNGGNISNCYSTSTVISDTLYIGGLAGWNSGNITDCYSTGTVSGDWWYIGGLVGLNESGSIRNCYSTAAVSSPGPYDSSYVGGLTGWNGSGNIINCYSMGAVSNSGDSNYIGGLVGWNDSGNILDCYSTGVVSANDSNNVGGMIGYNRGVISNCYSTGAVNGSDVVGGLVGYDSGGISDCYSAGSVSGSNHVGGLVGEKSGGISNCCSTVCSFWDTQTSGQTTSAGGMGKTTAAMQNINTFLNAGWDFIHYWQMGGYPVLSFFIGPSTTASQPRPVNGDTAGLYVGESPDVNLTWRPGIYAVSHDVYFSTSYSDVYNATTATPVIYKGRKSEPNYLATGLSVGATYYWRIDEVSGITIWRGSVWSFTTGLFIDDFERYNSTDDVNANWQYGYTITSTNVGGSGNCNNPDANGYAGRLLIQDAFRKYLQYTYNNDGTNPAFAGSSFSETKISYSSSGVSFTGGGAISPAPKALRIDYKGRATNAANVSSIYCVNDDQNKLDLDRMYVAIEDTAHNVGIYLNPDPYAQQVCNWTSWYIALKDINDINHGKDSHGNPHIVNLEAITGFAIGFGMRGNTIDTDSNDVNSIVMFDNIQLEQCGLSADFTGDCFVNFNDFAVMGKEWHNCGGQTDLVRDCFVDLMDLAVLAEEWLK